MKGHIITWNWWLRRSLTTTYGNGYVSPCYSRHPVSTSPLPVLKLLGAYHHPRIHYLVCDSLIGYQKFVTNFMISWWKCRQSYVTWESLEWLVTKVGHVNLDYTKNDTRWATKVESCRTSRLGFKDTIFTSVSHDGGGWWDVAYTK